MYIDETLTNKSVVVVEVINQHLRRTDYLTGPSKHVVVATVEYP